MCTFDSPLTSRAPPRTAPPPLLRRPSLRPDGPRRQHLGLWTLHVGLLGGLVGAFFAPLQRQRTVNAHGRLGAGRFQDDWRVIEAWATRPGRELRCSLRCGNQNSVNRGPSPCGSRQLQGREPNFLRRVPTFLKRGREGAPPTLPPSPPHLNSTTTPFFSTSTPSHFVEVLVNLPGRSLKLRPPSTGLPSSSPPAPLPPQDITKRSALNHVRDQKDSLLRRGRQG